MRPLSVIRRRVDRLATQARSGRCKGDHRRHRVVDVFGDDPTPPWPEQEQGERCATSATLWNRSTFAPSPEHLRADDPRKCVFGRGESGHQPQ